MTETNYIKQIT